MRRVVHFEIPADNPDRLVDFYGGVFGWKVNKWESGASDYWLISTGDSHPGIDGGMMRRSETVKATVNTIEVESLEETLSQIEDRGGQLVQGPQRIPGVGSFAYCTDPDGNLFGVMQSAPAAGQ